MKAFLMYRSLDFDLKRASPPNEQALVQDLELDTLFSSMSRGDKFILEVVRKVILTGPYEDRETIKYRQAALTDCLGNAATLRQIYALAIEAGEREKKIYGYLWNYPSSVLDRSVSVVQLFVELLKRLRAIADKNKDSFKSDAFLTLFAMLGRELSNEYFSVIDGHLRRLQFRGGVLVSAELGRGLKGTNYAIRKPNYEPGNWLARLWDELTQGWDWVLQQFGRSRSAYQLYLNPRDQAGAEAMSELRNRGVGLAASTLAQCSDHMLSFFNMLRTELAFYIGCVNLREQLDELKEHISFPAPVAAGEMIFSCKDLYDVCLALSKKEKVVGNDVTADNKKLIIITGANTGGKSTFLRSVGLAQLMLQCGMFVPATYLRANLVDGVFTHYKREEDTTMKSGKFDEELARMNQVVSQLTPHAMILFNESFAATNEREGSEVARQIVSALLEKELKLVFVTHLYEFARGVFELQADTTIFLRADRREDGRRTFKLVEGKPLPTSFGEDLYRQIFLDDPEPRSTDKTLLVTNSSAA
jgi:ABC-type histidine transport system ATPase subunit